MTARECGAQVTGTEHLLMAIVKQPSQTARGIVRATGKAANVLMAEARAYSVKGTGCNHKVRRPQTPSLVRGLAVAHQLAVAKGVAPYRRRALHGCAKCRGAHLRRRYCRAHGEVVEDGRRGVSSSRCGGMLWKRRAVWHYRLRPSASRARHPLRELQVPRPRILVARRLTVIG